MRNLWEFKGCVKIWQKDEIMMRMMRRIGRWKMLKQEKHGKSSHMNQDVLKWYDKVKRRQPDEKRTKRGKKMKRWWNDDAQLYIDT